MPGEQYIIRVIVFNVDCIKPTNCIGGSREKKQKKEEISRERFSFRLPFLPPPCLLALHIVVYGVYMIKV